MKIRLLAVIWLAVVAVGLGLLLRYAASSEPMAPAPVRWPVDSPLAAALDHPTLILFAHPRCPCTRASIEELARIMARCRGGLTARVVVWQPGGVDPDWSETDLRRRAEAIPGVTVHLDAGGGEATRHGATTSGQVLVCDARGVLQFRGGITAARGHEGDSRGKLAVIALATGRTPSVAECPVFGCPITDEPAPGGLPEWVTP